MLLGFSVFLALGHLMAAPGAGSSPALRALLQKVPADSLIGPLHRFEIEQGRGPEGGEAALLTGRLHYARGEYRQAADAFARAAARLDPSQKHEARYWAGMSWLALRDPNQTRAALEEVAQSDSPRRTDAMLGIAMAWELAGRPERALEVLDRLLAGSPGEAGPGALEHLVALADRQHLPERARSAREQLMRDYPRSIEAARAATPAANVGRPERAGSITVQIGVFSSLARARVLANAAQRSGFAGTRVLTRGQGRAVSYTVSLGTYPSTDQAKRAGEQAARRLGVAYRLVGVR
jgi:tetratricopeptide (TPR) repeat protein